MFVSYAQNFEDVILNRIFKNKKSGFYIDVGAHHPIYDSITKAFYDRGWRGINIEPVSEFFELLKEHRPHDINLPLAVGDQLNQLEFFELHRSGFSTLDRDTAIKLAAERKLSLSCYEVNITTLTDICQQYAPDSIDFLKVDVEGWEEKVILGNDWKVYRPTVIIIEATIPNSPIRRKTNITNYLQGKSYEFVYFDGLNDYYLAEESSELRCHFKTPPNVFDDFTLFRTSQLMEKSNNLEQQIKIKEREIIILSNDLIDERWEVQRLTEEMKTLKLLKNEQINHFQNQLNKMQILAAQSHRNISQVKSENAAMKTSKFWKLRRLWFRLKKWLKIPTN